MKIKKNILITSALIILIIFVLGCKSQKTQETVEQKTYEPSPPILTGWFNVIFGDPQNVNEPSSQTFSLTDNNGNKLEIKINPTTKFIGAQSVLDFNGKKVKIVGKYMPDVEFVEAVSIEFV